MKCLCPACGRTTQIEPQLLEFFDRCNRCGVLLRPRVAEAEEASAGEAAIAPLTAKIVPIGRVREAMANANGRLADLLSRPARAAIAELPREAPSPIPMAAVRLAPTPARRSRWLRRAVLRQQHQTLGIIGLCGAGLVALLTAGALALKARSLVAPRTSRGEVLQVVDEHPVRSRHEIMRVARGDPEIP